MRSSKYADLADLAPSNNGDNGAPETGRRDVSLTDEFRAALIDTAAVRSLNPPEPLVGSWLVRDSLATLYGPSGAGKTFLTLDWALHVATGSYWHGNPVHTGPVVYVIAEGASGIGRRIDAWSSHHQLWQLDRYQPIRWLPRAVNLADTVETAAFAAVAAELDPVLVIFDTLARCTVGAEENSARDMGLVVANLDRVRRATGACVLAVHHSGKDGTAGARGSSALQAAMDTELELTGADDRLTLRVTKQKDGPEPEPLHLARIASGESCVLVPTSRVRDTDDLPAGVAATLAALRDVQVPGGVSAKVWRMAVDVPERTFYRHLSRLLKAGLVRNVGSTSQPRYVPADQGERDDASCRD